jgi:hypothetical protein
MLYSLIRGPIADWYPYPFLNPDENEGYLGVATTPITITIALIGLVLLVTKTLAMWSSSNES